MTLNARCRGRRPAVEFDAITEGYRAHAEDQPGALAAMTGDGWEWAGAAGRVRRHGKRLRPDATVRVASVTKTFTAAAVLRSVEYGILELDAAVAPLVSSALLQTLHAGGYRPAAMTVRHLLHHTSGLSDWGADPAYDRAVYADPTHRWSRLEQVRWAMDHGRPIAPPGRRFHYSDTGYVVLGEILERLTRMSLAGALRTLLRFDLLELGSIFLETLEAAPEAAAGKAHQYTDGIDLVRVDASADLWGGGGLVASMPDLNRFVRALFHGGVFDFPATLDTMLAPASAEGAAGHGMGISVLPLGSGTWWGHPGFWGVVMAYSPERSLAVSTTITRRPEENPDDRFSLARHLIRKFDELESSGDSSPAGSRSWHTTSER